VQEPAESESAAAVMLRVAVAHHAVAAAAACVAAVQIHAAAVQLHAYAAVALDESGAVALAVPFAVSS
jgi:hypothetical protein